MLRHLSARRLRYKIRQFPFINTTDLKINFATVSSVRRSQFEKTIEPLHEKRNMRWVTLAGPEGYRMPIVGLGTWKATQDDVYNAVTTALDVGYRHIDTAFNYNNEEQIGKAINEWISSGKGTRESLFVTTKLPNFGNRPGDVEKYLRLSLNRLQLDYVDLYLIHMPFALYPNEEGTGPLTAKNGKLQIDLTNDNVQTWKAMEAQVTSGLTRSIGLSNFNEHQTIEIYDSANIKPAVLQIEMHARLQQRALLEACKRIGIAVTAYAPLGSNGAAQHFSDKYKYDMKIPPNLLTDPVVLDIAKKHNRTAGQILLRHLVEKDVIVIPKSSNANRIRENFTIFDFSLEDADRKLLDSLDREEEGRLFNFLFFRGIEKHPNYPFKI